MMLRKWRDRIDKLEGYDNQKSTAEYSDLFFLQSAQSFNPIVSYGSSGGPSKKMRKLSARQSMNSD